MLLLLSRALLTRVSPGYFVRQINLESGFNPNAVSPSGAVGIAQSMPSTAAGLEVNPWDQIQALRSAAHLMARYAARYRVTTLWRWLPTLEELEK